MNRPNEITARRWRSLDWRDPKTDLINLGKIQLQLAESTGITPKVADLRERELRKYLEWRQAALFAYFVSYAVVGEPIAYVLIEDEDYDAVIWRKSGKRNLYTPVQLKEVVPRDLNPKAEVNAELAKLTKYVTSEDTVVAVHLNQSGRFEFHDIKAPDTSCKEIWLYGAQTADQSKWLLYGDILNNPKPYDIRYPT